MQSLLSDDQPLLTVIVPAFNEAATIDVLLRRVLAAPYTKQILVVDDGSTDGTSAILSEWERQVLIEVCRHDRNRGKGRAIRTALQRARGRFVIIQDGDLETDPQDYPRLLEPLLWGRADFVIGSRFIPGSAIRPRVATMFRAGVLLLNFAVWLLYRVRVSDEACCYKILPTQILKAMDLQCERFEFCPEVVAKASRLRLRMIEVPVRYFPRTGAGGKKIRYRDGLRALWSLWKLRRWNSQRDAAATSQLEKSSAGRAAGLRVGYRQPRQQAGSGSRSVVWSNAEWRSRRLVQWSLPPSATQPLVRALGATTRRWTIAGACLLAVTALAGFSPYLLREWSRHAPTEPFFEGMGTYSRKITTTSPLAQRYFDQGLTLLYGFNDDEAACSFQAAAEADPNCAMAYWGIAMANRGNTYEVLSSTKRGLDGWRAARKAEELGGGSSPVEQALIRAIAIQYREKEPADLRPLNEAYACAMRTAWQRFPDDPDVASLASEAATRVCTVDQVWSADGKLGPAGEAIMGPLDAALRKKPDHLFALHYYVHVTEMRVPQRGAFAADRLRNVTPPGLGHLLHMSSHIDIRLGRWHDALIASERAVAGDEAYLRVATSQDSYRYLMAHSQHMLAYIAATLGQSERATKAGRDVVAVLTPAYVARRDPFIEYFFTMPYDLHLRFGQWDAMLAEPQPSEQEHPLLAAKWHFARGVAFAAKHRVAEASFELQQFTVARQAVANEIFYHHYPAAGVLSLDDRLLRGEILYRKGKVQEAVERLKEAVALEDGLGYAEPPDLIQPVRHVLGATLMDVGRYAEAEAVYREDLLRNPENGWSLYGLSRSLQEQGKKAEAASVAARFEKAWQYADIKLTASCLCLPETEQGRRR